MKRVLTIISAAAFAFGLAATTGCAGTHAERNVDRDRTAYPDRDQTLGRDRDRTFAGTSELVRADELIGSQAETPDGRAIGTVQDILLDDQSSATAVVVSTGTLIPWNAVEVRCGYQEQGDRGQGYREPGLRHRDDRGAGDHACTFVINEPEGRYGESEGDRGDESRAQGVSEWRHQEARTADGRELGRIDDLVIEPQSGSVVFVLINVERSFRTGNIRTVAVPVDNVQRTGDGISVDVDEQQLAQMAISDDRDLSELGARMQGLRYGHQERHHDRSRDNGLDREHQDEPEHH